MIHELKCWPEYFRAVKRGEKPFELRKNDRDFKMGDTLQLFEYAPGTGYTGELIERHVSYILDLGAFPSTENPTLPGYVVMGMADPLVDRLTADLAAMTAERDAMRERAEAAERDLGNAQPCFACKVFERNGGPCFGAGRCRVAALRAQICNVPYDDTSEWEWRGPVAENREGT